MKPICLHMLSPAVWLLLATASTANPTHWEIVEQINRTDTTKTWISPTAVDLDKMLWQYQFDITKVTGTVNIPFLGEVTEDITSSIAPETRSSSGEIRDLPAILLQDTLVEASTGTSADVVIEIDSLGYGRAMFSNIVLGSVEVAPFGSLPIQRINFEASVLITGYEYGDYDRNGVVDAADYVVWRKGSAQHQVLLAADGDNDNFVDDGDYWLWNAHFGQSNHGGSSAPAPEPATLQLVMLLALAGGSFFCRKR